MFQKACFDFEMWSQLLKGRVRDSRSLASVIIRCEVKVMDRLELFSENMLVCNESLN